MIKNAYPELPEVPYEKTEVDPNLVIDYINDLPINKEAKRASYIVFAIESAHGRKGVNNNYAGIQADGNRLLTEWADRLVGTCVTPENMTGKQRRFVVFGSWKDSVDYLIDRVQKRGLFIGGIARPYSNLKVIDSDTLARAYWKEWVEGDNTEPPISEKNDFVSMYKKACVFFA
jgi:hypothetical protein